MTAVCRGLNLDYTPWVASSACANAACTEGDVLRNAFFEKDCAKHPTEDDAL